MTLLRRPFLIAASIALGALLVIPAGGVTLGAEGPPVLVDIRAAHYPGYDRIVFEFDGGMPQVAKARWASDLRLDPSDKPAHVHGRAFIKVRFRNAVAHQVDPPQGSTFGPFRRAYALPNISHAVLLGDVEGEVTIGLGLMKRTRIVKTYELKEPSRFVVHVATVFPKVTTTLYFIDQAAVGSGERPYVVPVSRRVPKGSHAKATLHRLYAGPTQAELDAGLRFVDSGTTGFRGLWVNARGIARVRLLGPCDSGGSAEVTIAAQVAPTLRARPSIDWVKIYDRHGETEEPWGKTDSIPFCLEP